jgi:transcriptional regulator
MYIPKHYESKSEQKAIDTIVENPFATLITVTNGESFITQITLTLENDANGDYLFGHLSKANPQCKHLEKGARVHCLFSGPHHYISPSWYQEPSVPTWNYISTQVWGVVEPIMNADEFLVELNQLVNYFESAYQTDFKLSDLNEQTVYAMMNAIYGFRIRVKKVQGKHKLNQNKSEASRNSVKEALMALNSENARSIANQI